MNAILILQSNYKKSKKMLIRKNHLNLLRKIAWSFYATTGIDWQELFSEAALAYCKALKSYNPNRGRITTHLWNCVKSELINFIKEEKRYRSPLQPLNGTEPPVTPSYLFEYLPLPQTAQKEFELKLKEKYGWSNFMIEQITADINTLIILQDEL